MSRVVAYLCRHSGMEALSTLEKEGYAVPDGIECRETACAGSIATADLLGTLEAGAAAVAVVMCHEDACTHLAGNTRCGKRIGYVKRLFAEAGLDAERVREYRISNVQSYRLKNIFKEITELKSTKYQITNSKGRE